MLDWYDEQEASGGKPGGAADIEEERAEETENVVTDQASAVQSPLEVPAPLPKDVFSK